MRSIRLFRDNLTLLGAELLGASPNPPLPRGTPVRGHFERISASPIRGVDDGRPVPEGVTSIVYTFPMNTPKKRGSPPFSLGRPNPPSLSAVADTVSLELVFRALANETRRGILGVLHDWGGPLSSHDIARRFDLPWQGVSWHLKVLTEAGLISCEVQRNGRLYALERDRLRGVAGRWIARVATEGARTKDGKLVFDFAE